MRLTNRLFAPAFAACFALLAGCSSKPHSRYWTAMDCNFDATIHGEGGIVTAEQALDSLQAMSARYERLFTDYDPSGPISVLRGRKGDTVSVDPEIVIVLRKALETDRHSGNSFDMGVHDLKQFWGIGGGTQRVPPTDSIHLFLKRRFGFVPSPTDTLPDPIAILPDGRVVLLIDSLPIDLGGIAKGYTVDKMSERLDELGYPNHLIQGGGEIRAAGRKRKGQWAIGIKNPRNTDTIVGVISLDSGRAVSTSGDYERFFIHDGVRYHHIFDPRTGSPARGGTISVTLLCPSSFTCDAWGKPLFVLGPRRGRKLADSLGLQAFWIRDAPGGPCSRRTDLWGARLEATVLPTCPSDW
jgi:FAD:protein FMN transferase